MFTYLVIFPGQPGFYTNSYNPDNFEAGMIIHNLNNATHTLDGVTWVETVFDTH